MLHMFNNFQQHVKKGTKRSLKGTSYVADNFQKRKFASIFNRSQSFFLSTVPVKSPKSWNHC